jgi:microcin C transport system substrate-binding protein
MRGDPAAVRGGVLTLHTPEFPESFNSFINNEIDVDQVTSLVYDTLLDLNPDNLEFEPLIASSWKISPDKKTFTFTIDPRAKWSDGQPITAQDVSFTYDTIMDKNNLTSVLRLFFDRFEKPVITGERTIRFTAKTVHYENFVTLAGMNILPEHLYKGKDFNKSFNMALPGSSGPYSLSEVRDGRGYTLTRRKDYWADVLPGRTHMFNFDKIIFRVIRETDVAFEAFKKGDFDVFSYYTQLTPRIWVTQTGSEKFKKNWIVKQRIYSHTPWGFRGLALNMRKPVFKDIRVRKALFMLLDRKTIIDKLLYGMDQPLNSYFPNIGDNTFVPYNPAEAGKLLGEAGYNRLDKDGYLVNIKGERLEFSILSTINEDIEKYLTIYAQSCKEAGIKVNLDLTSVATLTKKMNNYDFDAVRIGFTGSIFEDPEQLWHSRHAQELNGNNLPGYKNPEVDELIDSLPPVFNAEERNNIIRRMDKIIYSEVPFILFWEENYYMLFYKNAFGHPGTYVSKYGSFDVRSEIIAYWWYDPLKLNKLKDAEKQGTALPVEPEVIYYDRLAAGR